VVRDDSEEDGGGGAGIPRMISPGRFGTYVSLVVGVWRICWYGTQNEMVRHRWVMMTIRPLRGQPRQGYWRKGGTDVKEKRESRVMYSESYSNLNSTEVAVVMASDRVRFLPYLGQCLAPSHLRHSGGMEW
jgi:hypothetical protein